MEVFNKLFAALRPEATKFTVPSFREQTEWPCGIYSFPDESVRRIYFNCAIVHWRGTDWLITRQMVRQYGLDISSLAAWELKDNVPGAKYPIGIQKYFMAEQHEDPRAFIFKDKIVVACCNFIQQRTFAHQIIGTLSDNFAMRQPVHLEFGKNRAAGIQRNKGHEKNWTWFVHDGAPHFVYRPVPHLVCRFEGKVTAKYKDYRRNVDWKWGDIRGGTCPERVGDEYISFFHSSLPINDGASRRYYMGAYAFEAKPPFRITRYTRFPMLVGSEADKGTKPVVFPCGSIFRNGEWLVVGGLNDWKCFWLRIPHEDLEGRLVKA